MVQTMKLEMESLKKTQTEIKLQMKTLVSQTETTEAILTNKEQDVEDRISGIENKVEETDSSVK